MQDVNYENENKQGNKPKEMNICFNFSVYRLTPNTLNRNKHHSRPVHCWYWQ